MTKGDRAAWTMAFRICDSLLPAIQAAAAKDDSEAACKLFAEAQEMAAGVYNDADKCGKLLLIAVYEIIEKLYAERRQDSA